jgi:hypothetical protein
LEKKVKRKAPSTWNEALSIVGRPERRPTVNISLLGTPSLPLSGYIYRSRIYLRYAEWLVSAE